MQGRFLASGLPAFLALRGRLAGLDVLRLAGLCPSGLMTVTALLGIRLPGLAVLWMAVARTCRMLTGVMRIAVLSEILHGLEYPIF